MRDRAPISSMNQHFHCQRCQQPLDLNERDFLSEDTGQFMELLGLEFCFL